MSAGMSGKTRLCGVIGDPIEHTMSPAMCNAAFTRMGLDYVYVSFQVKEEELSKAIDGMRALNIRGLNVTIPHKVAVIPLLDELDPLAEKIGAVNTISNDNGVLKGYNTDASGFLQALLERGIEPEEKKVVMLGAGGASRAISFILVERGAHLVILNRRLERAEKLTGRLSTTLNKEVKALELVADNLAQVLGEADILVNATSVGMSPNINETPVPSSLLKPGLVVVDIVYNPIRTRLLREAEEAGAKTINGVDMFVWQGIALIGFMGVGKTVVGKVLAKKLNKEFVELDSLIERKAGKPIPEIFEQDGEVAFRELEIEVIKEVAGNCGGGIVLNKINIDRLRKDSVIVYLTASPSVILKRVSNGGERPVLKINDLPTIQELLRFRKPFYEREADITINTSKMDIDSVAGQIIEKVRQDESLGL